MNIENVTKEQLINKLVEMHHRIIELNKYEKKYKHLERLLVENKWKYSSMLETSSIGVLTLDSKGVITSCNDAALDFSGLAREDLIGKYFSKRINLSTKEIPKYIEMFKAILEGKEGSPFEISQRHKNGDILFGEVYLSPLKNEDNKITGFKIIIKDITQEKKVKKELQEIKDKFNLIFKSSLLGVVIHDNGKIMEVNDAFKSMFRCGSLSPIGKNLMEFIAPEFRVAVMDKIRSDYKGCYEIKGLKSTSSKISIEITGRVIKSDRDGQIRLEILNNINEQRKAEKRIRYLSFHDKLTGLYNRTYFEKVLANVYRNRKIPLNFLICDLNGLKLVNDAFGNQEGDKLLKRLAKILKYCAREEDIIARWGEDEFFILMPRSSEEDVREVRNKVRKICAKTRDQKIPLGISIGTSTREITDMDLNDVVKEAENNMYKNKLLERKSIYNSIILSLERVLWEKNHETKEHAERLKRLILNFGISINMPQNKLDELVLLSALHDIGKVAIPDKILMKKSKLNSREWDIIRRHPEIGYKIAESTPQIAPIAEDILAHHEWWNGTGYPQGLKEKDIPVNACIGSIVDAYDVMITGRPYKEPITEMEAVEELRRCAGIQFHPVLVEKFIDSLGVIVNTSNTRLPD